MKISIVSPWAGSTVVDLANDYYTACSGVHQVVTVDNGTPAEQAAILQEMTQHLGGDYSRNEKNLGFAAGNNQGYARASGDIIIFLNSDIAASGPWLDAVRADVRDGALYGPSLHSQLVAGRHLPYIEGWCIAATRATWGRIAHTTTMGANTPEGFRLGPWDAWAYPGPYWEDNDLCLRALQAGISLIQTEWAIQHKGGRTAGPIMRHGGSFARNERTFTKRALAAFPTEFEPTPTWHRYMQACYTQSDIQHHLGLLYSLARGNVVELGTRSGISTAALLAGVEAHGGHVWSIDVADCATLYPDHEYWTFLRGDSRDPAGAKLVETPIDMLLIDTEHTYEQASAELALWAPHMRPGGYICLHDPETFPGVRRAVREFCEARGWPVTFVLPNNGMAVIEVPS